MLDYVVLNYVQLSSALKTFLYGAVGWLHIEIWFVETREEDLGTCFMWSL